MIDAIRRIYKNTARDLLPSSTGEGKGNNKYSPEKIKLAIELSKQGKKYREIAKVIGCSAGAVSLWVRKEKAANANQQLQPTQTTMTKQ